MNLRKIISGGQTGADRGALAASIEMDFPHGGWCPKGRKSEDGRIPDQYLLIETIEGDYPTRTKKNIQESDGTVIIGQGPLKGGSLLTQVLAEKSGKPVVFFDTKHYSIESIAKGLKDWIRYNNIEVLNVAGPRESKEPGIQVCVQSVIQMLLNCNT